MHSQHEEVKQQRTKWRCKECHFDNYFELALCEICQTKKSEDRPERIQEESRSATILCRNKDCKAHNPLDVDYCVVCAHPIFQEKEPPKRTSEKTGNHKDLIKCKFCQLENHISNYKCLNCNKLLNYIASKPKHYPGGLFRAINNTCEHCGNQLKASPSFVLGVSQQYDECQCQLVDKTSTIVCSFCDQKISKPDRQFHADTCPQRQLFFNKEKNPSFDRCSDLQVETILYMHLKFEPIHFKYQSKVLAKVRKLGYTEEDLENLHHYITNYAPIIVHMRANNHFQHFVKDTHYRNAFEISNAGKGGIGGRNEWQDRMFDKMHKHASNFERVKYGTMNFTNDPKGVAVCAGYGQSYFLLKSHVRNRCTITDMDSASSTATIGTFRFINNVLNKLSDNELKAAFEGSKGKQMMSNVIGTYKQIQIHGPIQFAKDIQRVYICKAELQHAPGVLNMVTQFCKKHKLEFETFDVRSQNVAYGFHNISKPTESDPNRIIKEGSKDEESFIKKDHNYIPGSRGGKRR